MSAMDPSVGFRCRSALAGVLALVSLGVRAEPPPPPMPPSQLRSTLLHGPASNAPQAKALLLEWLEAKRNSEEYDDHHDSSYADAARIIQAADGPDAVAPFLETEFTLTTSRRSRYAIQRQLAQRAQAVPDVARAIAHWELARVAVMEGQHPYYTTRQALPLMEIGRLLLESGRKDDARQRFEQYAASEYGQKEANGVHVLLGDLYEESGEWNKARALYEHYAQFPYYKNDAELRKRLGLPSEDDRARAATGLAELQNTDPAARRKARLQLYDLLSAAPNRDPWLRWLAQAAASETNPAARAELDILLPLLTPLADVPDPSRLPNAQELSRRMDEDRLRFQAHVAVFENLFSRPARREGTAQLQQIVAGSLALRDAAFTPEFRESAESLYASVRQRHQSPEHPSPDESATNDIQNIFHENPTLRDFLKTAVRLQTPQLGAAHLLLFALGHPEDIGFLINHIPDDPLVRNQSLLWLAMALERERLVDTPRVLGIDHLHVRNWWDAIGEDVPVRTIFQAWWAGQSNAFDFARSPARGQRVYGAGFASRITAIAHAPELDGAFFLEEGGFLDYSGSLGFFHFPSGACGTLTVRTRGETNGLLAQARERWTQSGFRIGSLANLSWNPDLLRCEFNISRDQRIGISFAAEPLAVASIEEIPPASADSPKDPSLGPGIQRRGDVTFEIRRGDLWAVHEPSCHEECLDDFGYYLSFALSRDGTRLLAAAREIAGPAWVLLDLPARPTPAP
jgi:hypothetical protein